MSDDYRMSFLSEMRMQFAMQVAIPRKVTKPKGEHHARMAEYWCQMARDLGRPAYNEAPGFTPDRWMLRDPSPTHTRSICGREAAYGFSRSQWRYIWLTMREAFLSGWHDAVGTTYETTEGGRSRHAILTGLTS